LFIAATILSPGIAAADAGKPNPKLEEMATTLATELAKICPKTDYGDTAAFKSCSASLAQASFLPFAPDILWGGDQASLKIKKRHLTHFSAKVFQQMYLPLMTFTGKWTIAHDDRENLDIIKLESYFRNELPAGEYPYPFWHSAAKWNAYEVMNQVSFYLNDKGQIFVATRGDTGSNADKGQYAHVDHEPFQKDHWQWTDEKGQQQPEVTLFSARYQASNPHMQRLDRTYRAFASEMRQASCVGCHNPSNPQDVEWLTLLQTPSHAAGEIDRVIKEVADGSMPQDELGLKKEIDPKLRESILRTAQAFRNELVAADAWEKTREERGAVASSSRPGGSSPR
jgi:hypothetical protein